MRGVLFDLDGTLINSWGLYLRAYAATLSPHYGREVTPAELLALNPTSETRLLHSAVADAEPGALHAEFLAHYAALHAEHFGGVYPGVAELLAGLRARGLAMGLVTGKSRAAWAITAPHCGLGPFDVVVADEDVQAPKPDAEGLLRALAGLGLAPARCLYVGDSSADLAAAQAAGMPFAAALWCRGEGDRQAFAARVRAQGARAGLYAPADLLALLDGAAPDVAAG